MNETECKFYNKDVVSTVELVYVFGIIIWILLCIILELYKTDYIGSFILVLPIIFFIISMFSFKSCVKEIENEIFQYDTLAFGVVIITIFLALRYKEYSNFFYKLIFVGILLIGLSMIDLWVSKENIIIFKHIKSILQTLGMIIFIYLFYSFYYISSMSVEETLNPFTDLNVHFDD